jgi:hypothetical protein
MRTQDLWHIGRAIGLPGFREDAETNAELAEMARDVARAKREDRKMLLEREEDTRTALTRVFHGEQGELASVSAAQRAVDQNFRRVNAMWMTRVRAKYQGSVIRRTGDSLDVHGNRISGLEPYIEHICMLELHTHEYDALETLAQKAMDDESLARRFLSEVSGCHCIACRSMAQAPPN